MTWNFGNTGLVSSNKSPDSQCWKCWKGPEKHHNGNCFLVGPEQSSILIALHENGKTGWWNLDESLKS